MLWEVKSVCGARGICFGSGSGLLIFEALRTDLGSRHQSRTLLVADLGCRCARHSRFWNKQMGDSLADYPLALCSWMEGVFGENEANIALDHASRLLRRPTSTLGM